MVLDARAGGVRAEVSDNDESGGFDERNVEYTNATLATIPTLGGTTVCAL